MWLPKLIIYMYRLKHIPLLLFSFGYWATPGSRVAQGGVGNDAVFTSPKSHGLSSKLSVVESSKIHLKLIVLLWVPFLALTPSETIHSKEYVRHVLTQPTYKCIIIPGRCHHQRRTYLLEGSSQVCTYDFTIEDGIFNIKPVFSVNVSQRQTKLKNVVNI